MLKTSIRGRLAASAGGIALMWSGAVLASAADAPTGVSEVVVTGAPRQEVKARVVQKEAPNLIAVQSAETILKYPDFNAAESLGRMPGISLSSDTGEGRFVQIRGIDANLDGATFGGVPLLNTYPGGTESGGGGRAVEFDTIPGGAIDGIVLTYTGMPDHEAEGLGGSIELTPRSAANIQKPFFEGDLGWGYEPLHDHTGPVTVEGAAGVRFGFGDHGLAIDGLGAAPAPRAGFFSNPYPFSLVLTASRKDDRRAVDDLEEGYIDQPGAPNNAISQYELRRYDYHRRRFAFGGEFDFEPNDDHRWYFRVSVAGYKEAVHKNFLLFTSLDSVFNDTGAVPVDPNNANGFLITTAPTITLTDEQEIHRNTIYTVGGEDHFDGGVDLDYHAAYSRATFVVDRNIGVAFQGPTVPITYDNVSNADYPIFTFPGGFNVNDASNYVAAPGTADSQNLGNNQNYDVDEEWSFAANLSFKVHLLGDDDRIKIGGEARLRDKTATEIDEVYDNGSLPLTSFSGGSIPSYYDGHLPNGPQINLYAIRGLITSGAAPLDPISGFNPTSYFNAWEDIYAGYVMYTGQRGPWGVLAGVRVEATEAKYGGFVADTDVNGNTVTTLQYRTVDYVNLFPTIQLKYVFSPQMQLRATWSTGIARPGFNQNSTAASIDRTQSPVQISRGNPSLQPTTGNNFDLSFEYYLNDGGVISVALFDKEFNNYIAPRIQNGVTNDPLAPGVLANVTTYINVNPAYARGVQLAWHQKFTFLPEPLKGFGLDANLTLVDSRILEYDAATSASGQNQYGLLPGTSKVSWNLAGFYEAHNLQLRLAAEYVSHSLFGLGGDKSLDTIQDNRLTLDWTSSYKVTRNVSVYFDAKNLLNTPLRYYEGEPSRPIQREFYDVTYEGGIRVSF